MASRCTQCGGELRYDIKEKKVKCEHCSSLFEPESFVVKTAADEVDNPTVDPKSYEANIYVCPNCGAEIFTTEFDAINYCLYCGSMVTLESNLSKIRKPDFILPFAKTMEECKASYKSFVRRKLYAPSEFRDESFISGFKGIYVPFWNYEYSYGPTITLKGEEEKRDGDYVYTTPYSTTVKASGKINVSAYDASSNFDDEISRKIAPFKREDMKKFTPAYLFGFFGDTADIDKSLYTKQADESVEKELWKQFSKDKALKEAHLEDKIPESFKKDLGLKTKITLAMVPVWFLTWRKEDRVAYSVMNGASGEMYAEIPISITRYLLFSLLSAIPIYFLLDCSFTFDAQEMLLIAMGLSVVMIMMYSIQLERLVRREMHSDDLGYLEANAVAKAKNEAVTDNLVLEIWDALTDLSLLEFILGLLAIIFIAIFQTGFFAIGFLVCVLGLPGYILYRIVENVAILKDKTIYLDIMGAILSIVAGVALLIWDPAPDQYYYASAMACMVGVGLAALGMVNRYNKQLTRPVPRFFNRKAGA